MAKYAYWALQVVFVKEIRPMVQIPKKQGLVHSLN